MNILIWYILLWTLSLFFVLTSGYLLYEVVISKSSFWFTVLITVTFTIYLWTLVDSIKSYVIMLRHRKLQREIDVERSFRKLGGD